MLSPRQVPTEGGGRAGERLTYPGPSRYTGNSWVAWGEKKKKIKTLSFLDLVIALWRRRKLAKRLMREIVDADGD